LVELNTLLLIYTKVATEEHHFGTSEYMLMLVAVMVDYGIGIAYAKIHQTKSSS
jgi:hypothetical protein